MNATARPSIVTDEHLKYLDSLRESGVTNMLGAGTYLQAVFDVSASEALEILTYWMKTFGQPTR